ncbi:MAG: hypothetical protein JJLCMIEE_02629 [Acidimicrobiales bacterium]|nr:hypothetical protein [Acidimicrobiales bacterium]
MLGLWGRWRSTTWLLVAVTLMSAGCSSDNGDASCGPVTQERLDPNSAIHLTTSAEEPRFLSDPPTSGPHVPGPPPTPVQQDPLPRLQQTAILEQGSVLLQYRDLTLAEEADLRELASDDVVVAPNPELPDLVVATAWTVKQVCSRLDEAVLEQFVADHAREVDPHEAE